MKLLLEEKITQAEQDEIRSILSEEGCIFHEAVDAGRRIIGITGRRDKGNRDYTKIAGVAEAVPIATSHKIVSRAFKTEDTHIKIGNVVVGGDRIVVIAGPCAVESRNQAMAIAREVKKYGAVLFRGGAYKPRSSPYSFQGLEEEGLKILAEVREETGLGVVTEMTSPSQAELMEKYVDVVQIGARNMQNFELLKCVGKMSKPVVLKRGLASTIQEWLMSAEYIASGGNANIILCERGIRTFEPYTRNTLDLSAIPVLKQLTHLPIVIDPSHATGIREKVAPMARAAVAAGADALMIEVHNNPDKALSDGPQSLYPEQFGNLTRDLYVIAPVVGKQMDFDYLKKAEVMEPRINGGTNTAAFTGENGSYSHKACLSYFGDDATAVPMKRFRDIFTAVENGSVAYGVVPVENSLSGSIHENYDLLQAFDVKIIGEVTIRIKQALITQPGADPSKITRIMAHPPAFSQCRNYLEQYPDAELIPVKAASNAVREVKEINDPAIAAIGSAMAAEIFELAVTAESIEDNPRNYTRFAIVAKEYKGDKKVSKTSIVFSTDHKPGSLFAVMKIFSEADINLVKLESRPVVGKPWEYMFYADLEADLLDASMASVMDELEEKSEVLRILGRY